MVPLLGYNPNISFDLFGILVISYIIDLKILNINREFSFDNINRYLLLVSDI
jgi:hypothetical protein